MFVVGVSMFVNFVLCVVNELTMMMDDLVVAAKSERQKKYLSVVRQSGDFVGAEKPPCS